MHYKRSDKPDEQQDVYDEKKARYESMGRIGRFLIPVIFGTFLSYLFVLFFFSIWTEYAFANSQWIWMPFLKIGALLALPLVFLSLGIRIIFKSGEIFLRQFHNLDDDVRTSRIIGMRLFGRPLLPPPFDNLAKFEEVKINKQSIEPPRHWSTLIGGPAKVSIEKGHAVYIEHLGLFSRVAGQESTFLHWDEKLVAATDVGPKTETFEINSWTLDGIKVTLQVKSEYFLGKSSRREGEENIYIPVDPESVRKAFEHTMKNSKEANEWVGMAKGQSIGIVSGYISEHYLDQLFLREDGNTPIFSAEVTENLENRINERTQNYGVCVSSFHITEIKLPPKVKEQRQMSLRAGHENTVIVNESEVKAHQIRLQERARAEMQRDLILTIANGLSRIDGEDFPEHLLLSVSTMLDQNMKNPEIRENLGKGALEILEKLQEAIKFPLDMPGDDQ